MIGSLIIFPEYQDRGSSNESNDYTLADDRPSIKAHELIRADSLAPLYRVVLLKDEKRTELPLTRDRVRKFETEAWVLVYPVIKMSREEGRCSHLEE